MDFNLLANTILETHFSLQQSAAKAVNMHLTIRNWLIGFYIVEFEQNGEDRAEYGTKLLSKIEKKIKLKGLTAPELSRCRQFYKTYPQIFGLLTHEFKHILPPAIFGLITQESKNRGFEDSVTDFNRMLSGISYTHFVELIKIEDALKRKYYELLILQTQPSVKELQRQIHTLSYERLGLSENKAVSFEQIKQKINPVSSSDLIKSHYFFEFLGVNTPSLMEESDLEQALITHLQEFILELGHGFCFEARQKRILIDDEYYFVDLVFYHRILKCHVLVDLKVEKFKHEHISQLNSYVAYYREEIMLQGDNPPIGILLCTEKGKKLVEYALSGMDEKLFVSKYLVKLPSKEQLTHFIENEIRNV